MSPAVNELLEQALGLGEEDRASLAGALLISLEPPPEPGAQEAWDAVIRRRVRELETGEVQGIPWSEAREKLHRGFD